MPYLTDEAAYRLQERLGIMYGDALITPAQFDDEANKAARWQSKHDRESVRHPIDWNAVEPVTL